MASYDLVAHLKRGDGRSDNKRGSNFDFERSEGPGDPRMLERSSLRAVATDCSSELLVRCFAGRKPAQASVVAVDQRGRQGYVEFQKKQPSIFQFDLSRVVVGSPLESLAKGLVDRVGSSLT